MLSEQVINVHNSSNDGNNSYNPCILAPNCSNPSCGQNEDCVLVNNTFTCVCKDGYEEPDCLRKNFLYFLL